MRGGSGFARGFLAENGGTHRTGDDRGEGLEEVRVGDGRCNWRLEIVFLLDDVGDMRKRSLEQFGREGGRLGCLERMESRSLGLDRGCCGRHGEVSRRRRSEERSRGPD